MEKVVNREDLLEMLEANLEHARHVENERITLNSIFTAIVAGVLAFTLGAKPAVGIVSTVLLMFACVLAMLLNKRWSDVFEGHTNVAKRLYRMAFGEEPELNTYYYMKHVPIIKKQFKIFSVLLKIRTRDLFAYFYGIIFVALGGLLAYHIWEYLAKTNLGA